MAEIRVSKIEAPRRQIDTAIRLLLEQPDPVSIHTLEMAAFGILSDLARKHGESEFMDGVAKCLKPGMSLCFGKVNIAPPCLGGLFNV